ncbi:questin oxidase family protein [Paucibacter sp. Y2R2-4]|uniref:questin oxidase family protein n=1 Tax=Paucibacter sp. Y2R2-4 TaxID=2893553 RepID=UPI0021E44CF3|nr:questin oxidase family protein [Paucibacter sp. Y2R2-4]MCV2348962.1 questin oxidase family protein [Paucibacter sp. Y2R2-4]
MSASIHACLAVQAPATPAASDLHAWLQRSSIYPPEYDDQLSSHLPMALQALHSMGADEAQMQVFFELYIQRFQGRLAPAQGRALEDWRLALGRPECFADLRASFERQLATQGLDEVLSQALPTLLPGLTAVAFHGAIRVAHAVEGGDLSGAEQRAELASALAYWASRWQRLPDAVAPARPEPLLSLSDWSQQLQEGSRGWRSEAPLIFLRMMEASAQPLYWDLAPRLPLRADLRALVADLASLALGYYLVSGNFTVLHMITGLRALRVLMAWLPSGVQDDPSVQHLLVQAFVAAYMAGRVQQRPSLESSLSDEELNWPVLIRAALASSDDHAIKLVHACREEMRVYGDARYLRAAALVLA